MFECAPAEATDLEAATHEIGCLCHTPAFARLNAALTQSLSRRSFLTGTAAFATLAASSGVAFAAVPPAPAAPLAFTNVRVFDGKSGALRSGLRVIVEGGRIKSVEPGDKPLATGVQTIDGGGRVLMPGLIDAHWHAIYAAMPIQQLLSGDPGFIHIAAGQQAEQTILRGFTSVRDMAGPTFGLKNAIDSGMIAGPRMWPSGAMISQTSGHGDFRARHEIPAAMNGPLSHGEVLGGSAIADGASEVLKRAREQLMLGATQLKLAAGGGVSSNYDPLDVSQFTEAEFRAAADAAENWGTYVTVHAYTPRAIQTAIRGGVRCIEHGQLMDDATAKILADKGIWFSSQPFLDDQDAIPFPAGSPNRAKQLTMSAGTDTAFGLAKKYNLKTAWGTDTLFDAKLATRQGAQLAKMKRWYSPVEILKMATSTNAELLQMCGPRNPYPAKIGVIEEGAFADILLVDGDPLTDIDLVADPAKNFKLIMKDGRIYKNTLAA